VRRLHVPEVVRVEIERAESLDGRDRGHADEDVDDLVLRQPEVVEGDLAGQRRQRREAKRVRRSGQDLSRRHRREIGPDPRVNHHPSEVPRSADLDVEGRQARSPESCYVGRWNCECLDLTRLDTNGPDV